MLRIAWRNLIQNPTRTVLSIGGVAAALLLILTLQGVFAGSAQQITVYIENSKADVLVSQQGVRNMHMARSVIPPVAKKEIEQVPGVNKVVPIVYYPDNIELSGDKLVGYIIGVNSTDAMGGPWRMWRGLPTPGPGELVVPKNLALSRGLDIGDDVKVGGKWFAISGLSLETDNFISSFFFMTFEDARLLRSQDSPNYLLVTGNDPGNNEKLARLIEGKIPGITALSRQEFVTSDRQIALQMGLNVIKAMSAVSLIVGLMVIMLTLYTSTIERIKDYGILKALGARNNMLFGIVMLQAFISTSIGFIAGTLLAWGVSVLVPFFVPGVRILLEKTVVENLFFSVIGIALLGSLLPTWRIVKVDPMVVFKS